ncbi:hypothetical protein TNCV_2364921 [Trichonephila clavipes]|nr:hypothetical protein TNCV_2364921 [Trichonephila clavipes]
MRDGNGVPDDKMGYRSDTTMSKIAYNIMMDVFLFAGPEQNAHGLSAFNMVIWACTYHDGVLLVQRSCLSKTMLNHIEQMCVVGILSNRRYYSNGLGLLTHPRLETD